MSRSVGRYTEGSEVLLPKISMSKVYICLLRSSTRGVSSACTQLGCEPFSDSTHMALYRHHHHHHLHHHDNHLVPQHQPPRKNLNIQIPWRALPTDIKLRSTNSNNNSGNKNSQRINTLEIEKEIIKKKKKIQKKIPRTLVKKNVDL